jgi:hypothetical protein
MACSLYVILAREAPRAVILRRGGTGQVRLILWHTDSDEFEPGQWLKGRIHGPLSDLSPDGSLFIYAAGRPSAGGERASEYGYAWTAISRPPYLTALALWPAAKPGVGGGSIYEGGGLFVDKRTILLDHLPLWSTPHPAHTPPRSLRVTYPDRPHFGLPDPKGKGTLPLELYRLVRDGWRVTKRIAFDDAPRYRQLLQPWILERPSRDRRRVLILQDDQNYVWGGKGRLYRLRDVTTGEESEIAGAAWADWDQAGRLAFARGGALFAAEPGESLDDARQIADFAEQRFESIVAPGWATVW